MANPEHLEILKKGVSAWNQWKWDHPAERPDFTGADLRNLHVELGDFQLANFTGANLTGAFLGSSNFGFANLEGANLTNAVLRYADFNGSLLSEAILGNANLCHASFHFSPLNDADLSGADLSSASFRIPQLDGAKLCGAKLQHTLFSHPKLRGTDFTSARFNQTILASADLSDTKGLNEVIHKGPSQITSDTLYKSQGRIPDEFLRGAGVPEDVITHLLPLIRAGDPIQFYSCFISYSGKDEAFAKRLHQRMRAAGLRVWFAPEDMKGGEKLHEQLERAIQLHDRLLLVLSDTSIQSPWVEREIRHACQTERKEGRRKLFPIRLTDYNTLHEWKCHDSKSGRDLAEEVRQYFIPDFSNWKDHDAFEKSFDKLLADLKSGAKTPDASPK